MKRLPLFLLLAASLVGCDTVGVTAEVEVRIENGSALVFDQASYWAGSEEVHHDSLTPGQSTPYVRTGTAYGYTTVQVVVASDTVRLQVIDFVGETPLTSGRYTYVIGLQGQPGNRSLTQMLRADA